MAGVRIYSAKGCPFCDRAKSFLEEKGITFEEIETVPESKAWMEMKEKTGSGSLPQIVIHGEPVGGYSDLVNMEAGGEFYKKLGRTEPEASPRLFDVIIIGTGPAGLSAAIYTARKVLKTLVIGKEMGGQVAWTFDVDNYLGFSHVDTADLISKFEEHVEKYGVEKVTGVEVTALDLSGKVKKVTAGEAETYQAKTVIIATGKRPRPLNVPGEKELIGRGVAYCATCDAPLFADLDVVVAGGGNSALQSAIDLIKVARKVYVVSLTPLTADQILQDKVTSAANVEIFTEYKITRVLGDTAVEGLEMEALETAEAKTLKVQGVFVEIGLLPNSELVVDTLRTNRVGEIVVDNRCRTGVAGVFACGDVTDVPYKQVVVAAGEGAKAGLSAYEYIITQK
ncbi:MAG: FAD-dependent oxidoreductase [Thermodesulfobacteriota bacterium]|nr:FAD-dependent oxidoreductase [Thermodesulfobacteriota bacterium]